MLDKKYVTPFQRMFTEQYDVIHRLETNKMRNVAKLFAHLLHTDAISWEVCTVYTHIHTHTHTHGSSVLL